jgi:hypothetical protein
MAHQLGPERFIVAWGTPGFATIRHGHERNAKR